MNQEGISLEVLGAWANRAVKHDIPWMASLLCNIRSKIGDDVKTLSIGKKNM
jgi:hypothetical protein